MQMVEQIIELRIKYYQTNRYENYLRDLLQKANLFYEFQQMQEAEQIYQQIIDEAIEKKDADIYIKSEAMLGIARINEQVYPLDKQLEIVEKIKKLLSQTETGHKSESIIMCYKFESEIYLKMGEYQQSLDNLELCCKVYDQMIEASKNEDEKIKLMTGNFHTGLRNYEMGLDFFFKAKSRWELIDPEENNQFHIELISNIGIAYTIQGDMEHGMPFLNQAMDKLQPVTQENVQIFIFNSLHIAKLWLNLEQIEKSLKITEKCWQQIQEFQVSPDMELQVLEHFANLYIKQDKFDEAKKHLKQAFKIVDMYGFQNLPIAIRLYFQEGLLHLKFQDYYKAKEYGEKVKSLAEEIFGYDDEQVADGLSLIGKAQYYIGKMENNQQMKNQGIENIKQSINMIEYNPSRLGNTEKALFELCKIYASENSYRDGIIQAERIRRIKFTIIQNNYVNPSDIKTMQAQVDEQIELYIKSIKKLQIENQQK